MSEVDRRIKRTRRALAEALITLASSRPYESISIRDIANQADVGYATFFRHYDSKDDLMLGIFQNIAQELEAAAAKSGDDFFEQEGRLIFSHVRENKALYRSILDSMVFKRKLQQLFNDHIANHVQQHLRQITILIIPVEVAVNHMATSLTSLIEWWLEHNLQPSVDKMAHIYDQLVIQATWGALAGNTHGVKLLDRKMRMHIVSQ